MTAAAHLQKCHPTVEVGLDARIARAFYMTSLSAATANPSCLCFVHDTLQEYPFLGSFWSNAERELQVRAFSVIRAILVSLF